MSERKNVLLLTGPHGAGKDSAERLLRATQPNVSRIVRHITRQPSSEEKDGVDYYFVSRDNFREMAAADEFIEYAEYPDVLSGTTYRAVHDATNTSDHATLTLNLEEALPLIDKLDSAGYNTQAYFISPVSLGVFTNTREQYLEALRLRMEARQRPDDRIDNKIGKAALYRTLYFKNADHLRYVANLDNMVDQAVADICTTL